jgi:hypothetical protein
MAKMGLSPIYQRPKTSEPHPRHKVYPYLLRHLTIEQPNQVWCEDVRLWHEAEVRGPPIDVRYRGNSGHRNLRASRQLMTQIRHAQRGRVSLGDRCLRLDSAYPGRMLSFTPIPGHLGNVG